MCPAIVLSPEALYRRCEPADIPFETTAQARDAPLEIVGQERAVDAIQFGIAIQAEGYNLFALGPQGIGKQTLIRQFLDREARRATVPADWCYVANLADPRHPRALKLPPGAGSRLRADMERAISELRVAMQAAFDSEEYRTRKHELISHSKAQQESALGEVQERARGRGVAVVRADTGIVIAPLRGDSAIEPAEFQRLPQDEQAQRQAEMERVGAELHGLFRQFHEWARQHQEALKALDRETAASVARRILDEVRSGYRDLPEVLEHLEELEKDVAESAADFLDPGTPEALEATLKRAIHREPSEGSAFRRYQVNVLLDHDLQAGAPVVYEDNPTYANLVGRIEHVSQFGALVTDFTLIRPGALHRASGGYLLLDVHKVLANPFAWEGLKRAIRTRQIRIESLGESLGLVPTISLEPEPVPLGNTKVILFGERSLYYLLATLDPDFPELFKVMVDFEESMERGPEAHALWATQVAALVGKEGLRPMDRGAVVRVVEHAARMAGDAQKLSLRMRPVVDLLREADFWAGAAGRTTVTAPDVQTAIEAQLRRGDRVRQRLLEAVRRDELLVDTGGQKVGQVNGLSVVAMGEQQFGHPTRITARVRLGKGEVLDIEREVELGGPIHSKGVLILGGFLGARYAPRTPLSLSASLVFEQSYGQVEGDSASLAELCALLSALAEVGIKQSIAVTGSVNQHGQVQPIGGVNDKIEGFFDVCRQRGLTGEQGVVIPKGNVKDLMVRREVAAAVQEGMFHVWAVGEVDEALELLTAQRAGARDAEGRFTHGSVNAKVEARLVAFAEDTRRFLTKPGTA